MNARTIPLFSLLLIASPLAADDAGDMQTRIEAQQQAADRHQWDARRDPARKPFETFMFLGLEPGMHVMDVWAGAGYTTEMLAAAVGPDGMVYSHNEEVVLMTFADGYYKRTMDERLGNDRLPNVALHISSIVDFGLDGQLDLVWWGNNFHDYYYHDDGQPDAAEILSAIYAALKPGGVLGLMDHVGLPESDNAELHRIDPVIIREHLVAAGFIIEEESDLFANPADGHDLMVYDDEIYLKTDRVLVRARKP